MLSKAKKRGLRLSVGSWKTIWMSRRWRAVKVARGDAADGFAVEEELAGGLVDQPADQARDAREQAQARFKFQKIGKPVTRSRRPRLSAVVR